MKHGMLIVSTIEKNMNGALRSPVIHMGWMGWKSYERITLVARSYILGTSCATIKLLSTYSSVAQRHKPAFFLMNCNRQ